ncbi:MULTISPECIES: NACHT domain-containing protein [unclassified Novosphingobium]|uniref:NACHT domain-containing protein n=1 Tax=unclassified Novosphingobium TaxID=2644732 RepID=UPI00146A0F85|nr:MULTISPECIES: NACHT domain-containing protein [unclassified Novosphingobium]NMN06477.1 hypothetical protein [Novosphingobium sp. SG919]NMN89075.1 hypothetical protein [Novosphingobium sp. SG916]
MSEAPDPPVNLDSLTPELRPYIEEALKGGASFVSDLGNELSGKAAGGLTSLGVNAATSIVKAIRNRRRRSKAWHQLENSWRDASDDSSREAAIRAFLAEDPRFASSLEMLLIRRDFVRAMLHACQRLPFVELLDSERELSEVYVPAALRRAEAEDEQALGSADLIEEILSADDGQYLIEGPAGSGKSVLARHLVATACHKLLDGRQVVAFDQFRLPVYVSARDLGAGDFTSAVDRAVEATLGPLGIAPLPERFFVPYAQNGHGRWLIVLDGLDEVDDPRARTALWDAITRMHGNSGNAFRFVVTARVGTISSVPETVSRWSIEPLSPGASEAMAERYARGAQRKALKKYVRRPEFRDVARVPLLLAIAASLFDHDATFSAQRDKLLEAYVDHLLDKAHLREPARRVAAVALLGRVALTPNASASDIIKAHRVLAEQVCGVLSTLRLEKELERILRSTGLVQRSGDRYRFLHDLFRSHFATLAIAERETPDPRVWRRIDPYRIGWTTVEALCVEWASRGLAIDGAVQALIDFKNAGEECALAVAARCPSLSRETIEIVTQRAFDLLEGGDSPGVLLDLLVPLATRDAYVQDRLAEIADERGTWSMADIHAATCLAQAGCLGLAIPALIAIAGDGDCYSPYRTDAAELLLENGYRAEGLAALLSTSEFGDEAWSRLEAACLLHEHDPTPANRTWLRAVVEQVKEYDGAYLSSATLEHLIKAGEPDLALPLLRQMASQTGDAEDYRLDVHDITGAAITIGRYHDLAEGKAYLETLLQASNLSLRNRVEALNALAMLDPDERFDRLVPLVRAAPLQIDWRVIDILVRYGREDVVWEAGSVKLKHSFRHRGTQHETVQLIEHLAGIGFDAELAQLLGEQLAVGHNPRLASCLALVGKGEEARDLLNQYWAQGAPDTRAAAAEALCEVGDRATGLHRLYAMARDVGLSSAIRLTAAESLRNKGAARRANAAFVRLVRDKSAKIEDRCSAARWYGEDEDKPREPVLNPLLAHLLEGTGSEDAKAVAATIGEIDPYGEYWDDIFDTMIELIEREGTTDTQVVRIASAFARIRPPWEAMPRVATALKSSTVSDTDKLDLIGNVISANDGEGTVGGATLSTIAGNREALLADRLAAVEMLDGIGETDQALAIISAIATDQKVPPSWRLKAALRIEDTAAQIAPLLSIAADEAIAVAFRLEALGSVHQISPDIHRELLRCIGSVMDLTIVERLEVANAAQTAGESELFAKQLEAALSDTPLSIGEAISLLEACRKHHAPELEERTIEMLRTMPLETFLHNQDSHDVIDAVTAIGTTDPGHAEALIKGLVSAPDVSWWDIAKYLSLLVKFAGQESAARHAKPILEELERILRDPDRSPRVAWISVFESLVEHGFSLDVDALKAFASNDGVSSYDRAIALARILDMEGSPAARRALWEFVHNEHASFSGLVLAAQALIERGHRSFGAVLADRCIALAPHSAAEVLSLAHALDHLGRSAHGDDLLRDCDPAALAAAHLWDQDKARMRRLFGEQRWFEVTTVFTAMAGRPDCEVYWEARDEIEAAGNPVMLTRLINAAKSDEHIHDRLEAINSLDEIGFRALARQCLSSLTMPDTEPYWLGAQLLRFGRKEQARACFISAASELPQENQSIILGGLADLHETKELVRYRVENLAYVEPDTAERVTAT